MNEQASISKQLKADGAVLVENLPDILWHNRAVYDCGCELVQRFNPVTGQQMEALEEPCPRHVHLAEKLVAVG